MSNTKILQWTEDGGKFSFPYETIKSGEFSKVFLSESEAMIKTREGCDDKEILWMVNREGACLNLPIVERVSWEENLYKMPRYSPITGNKVLNAQRIRLQSFWEGVRHHSKYDRLSMFNDAIQSSDLPDTLKESIDCLISMIMNYGSDEYALEFPPRNLAQDAAGNLILLDIFFKRNRKV